MYKKLKFQIFWLLGFTAEHCRLSIIRFCIKNHKNRIWFLHLRAENIKGKCNLIGNHWNFVSICKTLQKAFEKCWYKSSVKLCLDIYLHKHSLFSKINSILTWSFSLEKCVSCEKNNRSFHVSAKNLIVKAVRFLLFILF